MKQYTYLVLFAILLNSCNSKTNQSTSSTVSAKPIMLIAGQPIDTVWIPLRIQQASAAVRHYSFGTDGIVESIHVRVGQSVKKGELLATLSTTALRAKIKVKELTLDAAITESQRIERLFTQNARTAVQKDSITTAVNLARASRDELRAELRNYEIRAISNGVVQDIMTRQSEYALAEQPTLLVGEPNTEYELNSSLFKMISLPQAVKVRLLENRKKELVGTTRTIDDSVVVQVNSAESIHNRYAEFPLIGCLSITDTLFDVQSGDIVTLSSGQVVETGLVISQSKLAFIVYPLEGKFSIKGPLTYTLLK